MRSVFVTLSNEEWLREVELIFSTKFNKEEYIISQLEPVSIREEIKKEGNILILDSKVFNLNKPFEMINNLEVNATVLYIDIENNFQFKHENVSVFSLIDDFYKYLLIGKNEDTEKDTLKNDSEQYIKKHKRLLGKEEEILLKIDSSSRKMEEDKFLERANKIRNHSFNHSPYSTNKTIGVWSPIHRMGVTQFVVNFSIFLAQFRISIAALETPNNIQHLKHLLLQYTEMPNNWSSYANALANEKISPDSVKWFYQNVHWIPLDYNDSNIIWEEDMLYYYINNLKYFDVVMVDIPTSKMEEYSIKISEQIDELWILVDDSYIQLKSWKEYIHSLQKQLKIPFYLVFNKKESFSKPRLIEEELDLPIISEIPSVYQELQKNNYDSDPIILNHTVYKTLYDSYYKLAEHILGENIGLKSKSGVIRSIIDRFFK